MVTRRGFLIGAQASGLLAAGGLTIVAGEVFPELRPVEGPLRILLLLEGGFDALSLVFPPQLKDILRRRPSFERLCDGHAPLTNGWSLNRLAPRLLQSFENGSVSISLANVPSQPSHVAGLLQIRRELPETSEVSPVIIAPRAAACASFDACVRIRALDPLFRTLNAGTLTRLFAESPSPTVLLSMPGFDWHESAAARAADLLLHVDGLFGTIVTALQASGRWAGSVVQLRSELARAVDENRRGGIDHGGVQLVLTAGGAARGGLDVTEFSPGNGRSIVF